MDWRKLSLQGYAVLSFIVAGGFALLGVLFLYDVVVRLLRWGFFQTLSFVFGTVYLCWGIALVILTWKVLSLSERYPRYVLWSVNLSLLLYVPFLYIALSAKGSNNHALLMSTILLSIYLITTICFGINSRLKPFLPSKSSNTPENKVKQ